MAVLSDSRASKREFVMVRIPAGEFTMGSLPGHGDQDELPAHPVRIDEYLIGRQPVTSAEWARFLNESLDPCPRYFEPTHETTVTVVDGRFYPRQGCAGHPANGVTWYGTEAFCQWLQSKSDKIYRLPTEAEWEKAARGGLKDKRYPWGNQSPQGRAQYHQNWSDPKHTLSPVAAYPPNNYGLYDMVGNTWEWCSDWYDSRYYRQSPETNPQGPANGSQKVLRGGSWGALDVQVRCAIRLGEFQDISDPRNGFRLARSV